MSEADGGMAVETEPFCQYCIKFCFHLTNGSRWAAWQNDIWHGSVYEVKVCHWIPTCGKNVTWLHLTFAEHWWRPNSGCKHCEVVGGVFQQWWHSDVEDKLCSGQPCIIVTSQKNFSVSSSVWIYQCAWWCWKTVFCSWERALWNSIIVLFVVVVSMEINRRHYICSNIRVCS